MVKKAKVECCSPVGKGILGYRVEAVVSIDERGQMVLPKEVRERMEIGPGDKLAVVLRDMPGGACCLHLFKVSELASMVRELLGPMVEEVAGRRGGTG